MSIKLAINIQRHDIPETFKKNIRSSIPTEHLKLHPFGEKLRIFEEFVYDILRTFQNDISTIFIDDISKKYPELAKNIETYAKEHGYECLSKEDGNVEFTLLPDDSKVYLNYAESSILHYKIENNQSEKYLVIPLESVAYANKASDKWSSNAFYKEAFKEHIKFLKEYIEADI